MSGARTVHAVLPDGVDDPARPSGGNAYDRRVLDGLRSLGWDVFEHVVAGPWPWPDPAAERSLARSLAAVPDGATVLVDGLVASAAAAVLVPAATRMHVVVLVHLPLGDGPPGHVVEGVRDSEADVLRTASAVVVTSEWARGRLLDLYAEAGLRSGAVHVAEPGTDPAGLSQPSADGGRLLCVGAVTSHKGQDVLLEALAAVRDRGWRCLCVGPLDRDPAFVELLRKRVSTDGLADRFVLAGAMGGAALDRAYASADLLVVASHAETYAMVVAEALARGVPVLAAEVGGLPSALGQAADGRLPGLLVEPGDPAALAAALRRWLDDEHLRGRLREAALDRRRALQPWSATSARVADVLAGVAS